MAKMSMAIQSGNRPRSWHALMGMAFAVFASAVAQLFALVAAASNWLKISPLQFWPFGIGNVRLFFQQVAGLRWRYWRSIA
jgi:hypothetical protein